jgi:D-inositol-3-phosphate glycosyltransferase
MRVAFVSFHTSPGEQPGSGDAGGMNVYVDRLARALAGRGVAVDVFTRSAGPAAIDEAAPGVRTIALPAGPSGPAPKEELVPHVPAFADAVASHVAAAGVSYDLVHSHYWQSGLAAIPLARRWRVPLVHTHHTLGKVKDETRPPGAAGEPDERLRAEREVVAAAALVTASTEDERRRLAGGAVRTLAPGVDHRLFRPGDRSAGRRRVGLRSDGGPLLLAVGRIQPLKGLELAIRALRLLDPRATLVVAGGPSGPDGERELARLVALARRLRLVRRVRFVGPQPQALLPELYRAADALLVCSHSESFGLAALEAHACGTPVVGTTVGGLPTFVREGRSGFLLDRRDPSQLAARVEDVLRGGDAFRRAAVGAAAGFSWHGTAHALHGEYLRLLRPQTKMRLKASPYAKPAASPTAAKRRLNHCSNCA